MCAGWQVCRCTVQINISDHKNLVQWKDQYWSASHGTAYQPDKMMDFYWWSECLTEVSALQWGISWSSKKCEILKGDVPCRFGVNFIFYSVNLGNVVINSPPVLNQLFFFFCIDQVRVKLKQPRMYSPYAHRPRISAMAAIKMLAIVYFTLLG